MSYDALVTRLFVELPTTSRDLKLPEVLAQMVQLGTTLEAKKKSWRSGTAQVPVRFNLENLQENLRQLPAQTQHALVGLGGELGEVLSSVAENDGELLGELGDLLFYTTALAHQYGWSLDDVIAANTAKLTARFPNGYNLTDAELKRDKG